MDRDTLIKGLTDLGYSPEEACSMADRKLFDASLQKGIVAGWGIVTGRAAQAVIESKTGAKRAAKGYQFHLKLGENTILGPFFAESQDAVLRRVAALEMEADRWANCGRESGSRVTFM